MVRVGVIGCGYWGPNLVRVFHDDERSRVTALCDIDVKRLFRTLRRVPGARAYADVGELITDDNVDLVVVATPVGSHFHLARQALRHGKHVLVEKPMTQTSAQAEELIDLARRQGTCLAVDHTFVFTPAVEKLKELIDGEELGRLHYVDSVRINLGLIQSEVDVIWDLATHDLSILDFVIGRAPRRVVATGSAHTSNGQTDVAYIHLDLGDDLTANFHVNWLSPVKVRRMIFGGSRRAAIFDDLSPNEKIRVFDSRATETLDVFGNESGNDVGKRRVDYRIGDIWTPYLPPREALAVEAEHIVAAIESGRTLRADGPAGLRVVRMLEACRQSLEQYAAEANEMAAGVGKQVSTDARLVRTRGVDMDRIGSPVNTVVAEEDGASFESNDAQLLDISNTVQP